jgi:hypothetical protein
MRVSSAMLLLLLACQSRSRANELPPPRDAMAPVPAPVMRQLPLGARARADFAWSERAGDAPYRRARELERKNDWAGVVAACQEARAADPLHHAAAWLQAAALARQGRFDEVLPLLETAAAADWGHWGERSLVVGLFAAFRDSPPGRVWVQAADDHRQRYLAALAGAVVVLAEGDLFAYGPSDGRWQRLSRSGGRVRGAVASPGERQLAYVLFGRDKAMRLAVIDLAHVVHGVDFPVEGPGPWRLRWRKQGGQAELELTAVRARRTWKVDWQGHKLADEPVKGTVQPEALVVSAGAARMVRTPPRGVTADWDEAGLASAFRIDASGQTVVAPGDLLIDGTSMVWSPGHTQLAAVAIAPDVCERSHATDAVLLVDASSGRVTEIDHGSGQVQLAWADDHTLGMIRDGAIALHAGTLAPLGDRGWFLARPSARRCDPVDSDGDVVPDGEVVPVDGDAAAEAEADEFDD